MHRPPGYRRIGRLLAVMLALLVFLAACGTAPTLTVTPVPTATVAPTPTEIKQALVTATPTPTATAGPPTATRPALPATPFAVAAAATPTTPPTATAVPPTATPIPPTPTPVPRAGLPVRLRIPRIKVDTAIEYVGLTPDGAMDVPKNYSDTAWYELGPRPGEQGNAAIAGHVDSKTGPAVFWNLSALKPGDEIFVDGDDGVERRFVVIGLDSYKRPDAPLDQIFGPSLDRHLNLITCDSTSNFDKKKGEYAANVVVYTEYAP